MSKVVDPRRAVGCALALALMGAPVVVSTIELGSPSVAAPSRHNLTDGGSGLAYGDADWAFAHSCYGEFWTDAALPSGRTEALRLARKDPFASGPDGVSIILGVTKAGAAEAGAGGASGGSSGGSPVSGPIMAAFLSGGGAGGGGTGGGTGGGGASGGESGGGTGGGDTGVGGPGGGGSAGGGGLDALIPIVVRPPGGGEETTVDLEQTGGGGGGEPPVGAVPVPAALPLLLTGLAVFGIAGASRRRNKLRLAAAPASNGV